MKAVLEINGQKIPLQNARLIVTHSKPGSSKAIQTNHDQTVYFQCEVKEGPGFKNFLKKLMDGPRPVRKLRFF